MRRTGLAGPWRVGLALLAWSACAHAAPCPDGTGVVAGSATSRLVVPASAGVPNGVGGAIVAWWDGADVRAQRVEADGSLRWAASGVPVAGAEYVEAVEAFPDGAGGAFVFVDGTANGTDQAVLQRLGHAGEPLWPAGGVRVPRRSAVATDGSGGVFVSWFEVRDGWEEKHVLRLDALGAAAWGADGVAWRDSTGAVDAPASRLSAAPDSEGGVILAWHAHHANPGAPTLMRAQRLAADGTPLWDPGGRVVGEGSTDVEVVADREGGAYLVWSDPNCMTGARILSQRLGPDGAVRWAPGGEVVSFLDWRGSAIPDGTGGVIVVWRRGGEAVRAQRMDAEGRALWALNGVTAGAAGSPVGWDERPHATADGAGGCFVMWRAGERLAAQHLRADGTAMWPDSGLVVAPDLGGSPARALVPDGVGGALLCWPTTCRGTRVQRFGATGLPLWPVEPRLTPPGEVARRQVSLGPDGAGGAFVGWWEWDTERWSLRAERRDQTGAAPWSPITLRAAGCEPGGATPLPADGAGRALASWSDGGVRTVRRIGSDGSLAAVPVPQDAYFEPDGEGGVLVAWNAADGVRARRWGPDGADLWGSAGVLSCPPWLGAPVVGDEEGGAFVARISEELTEDQHQFLHVQHLRADGAVLWGPDGAPLADYVCSGACLSGMAVHRMVPDGTGGVIVVFSRSAGRSAPEVLRLAADGSLAWPASLAVNSPDPPAIIPDAAGGAFLSWEEDHAAGLRVIVHRYDAQGARPWGEQGVAICAQPGAQTGHVLLPDGQGGALVVWQDHRGADADIFAQRLDPTGAFMWPSDGVAVSAAPDDQSAPAATSDGRGGVIIAWEDAGGPAPEIRLQRLTAEGQPSWTEVDVTPGGYSLCAASAQPSCVRLEWSGPARSAPAATVYRREAREEWHPRANVTPDAGGRLAYEDRDVTAGARYGYRLGVATPAGERFQGEAWVVVPREFALALEGLRPQPATGALRIALTLPNGNPAVLELFDVAGRRLLSRSLRGLPPGPQLVDLGRSGDLAAGIYLLRLTHDHRTLTARACVLGGP